VEGGLWINVDVMFGEGLGSDMFSVEIFDAIVSMFRNNNRNVRRCECGPVSRDQRNGSNDCFGDQN
jgi:hypothetical protein